METLPCANEVVHLQEQHLHQQAPPLPLPPHSQSPVPMSIPVPLHDSSQQLVNLSNMEANAAGSMSENVVNIPKELILISLVSQEQALYNPKHQHYRSTQRKDEKWSEIGGHVGWSDTQCKAKWKAMRDQYCRELKRAKASAKANVKWKHFKELDFLRPYALSRNYRTRTPSSNGLGCSTTVTLPNVTTTLTSNNSFSSNSSSQQTNHKFGSIKIEEASASLLENCSFVPATTVGATVVTTATVADKKSDPVRLLSFIAGQISSVSQQPLPTQQQDNNWNYLTDASGASATTIQVPREPPQAGAEDTLYNDFVDCVNAATANQSTHNPSTGDEEDDDPIHTFLNMESYFEKELITLIQQEDMIYNYSNQNYRNVKLKLEVWDEIARKLKKPVKQCRQKWKALRDQYAREHKRLKSLMNMDAHSRWKHYDSLGFLQKYIQQKSLDSDAQLSLLLPKHEPDLDEHMGSHSPLRSEAQQQLAASPTPSSQQLNMPALPPLTGPHKAELPDALQQQHSEAGELCVASYDEMDIENYINGDVAHDEEEEDEDDDMEASQQTAEQQQSQQEQQQQHVVDYQNDDQEHVYIAVQNVSNALAKTQQAVEQLNDASQLEQQQQQQTQQQQQQQHLPAAVEYQQKLEMHTPTSTTTTRYHNAATPTNSHAAFPLSATSGSNDDDEIGAFFKAVAMKIRSAQLEPVAFTDLQINILRVINEALRHH